MFDYNKKIPFTVAEDQDKTYPLMRLYTAVLMGSAARNFSEQVDNSVNACEIVGQAADRSHSCSSVSDSGMMCSSPL